MASGTTAGTKGRNEVQKNEKYSLRLTVWMKMLRAAHIGKSGKRGFARAALY
jgi:hypothetical protein